MEISLEELGRYTRIMLKPEDLDYSNLPILEPNDLETIPADLCFTSLDYYQQKVREYLGETVFPIFVSMQMEPGELSVLPVPIWIIDKDLMDWEYYILFTNYDGTKRTMFHCEGA